MNDLYNPTEPWTLGHFQSEEFKKHEFARKLGLNFHDTQVLLDNENIVLRRNGLFSIEESMASKIVENYSGLYHMWHITPPIEEKDQNPILLRSTLRVRYALKIRKDQSAMVRCKLYIPGVLNIDPRDRNFYSYDGFIELKDKTCFWFFNRRENNPRMRINDCIQFVTKVSEHTKVDDRNLKLYGMYNSTSQEYKNIFSSPVFLQRHAQPDVNDEDCIVPFMKNSRRVYENGISDIEPEFSHVKEFFNSHDYFSFM